MTDQKNTHYFQCSYAELQNRLQAIDPVNYGATRNYLDGAVTWLSPFITHGILTTVDIADAVRTRYTSDQSEKLLFELAWREYFHRVWQQHGDAIFSDMKNPSQSNREHLPSAICQANTEIYAVDEALEQLFKIGSMHNHARMWVASLCCNLGNTHWLPAAKWMHYHLLDGDLASNTLSWQWIAGTFSHKRYFANQDNLNKYSKTTQRGTFLDIPYEQFDTLPIPTRLLETQPLTLTQTLPGESLDAIEAPSGQVAVRSVWHLDKRWQPDIEQQWLFIDEQLHARWPMNENRWRFIEHWASQIPHVRIVKGTVAQLQEKLQSATIVRQEYTACAHWGNASEPRTWLYPNPPKPYKSFSQFWKQVK